jgi:8-oxo-dGTP diphosphatase
MVLSASSLQVGVAVFVTHRGKPGHILLGQRLAKHRDGNPVGKDMFATPGGHLEFGETFEECAIREVQEECGVALKEVRFGTTLNVRRPEAQYHYVVICMVGRIDEVSSCCVFTRSA